MDSTLTEPPRDRAARAVALLTHVLGYEDLLADRSARFVLGETTTLGRTGDITVPERWASAVHARIDRRGGDYSLGDLGSRNGTYVNGERIAERVLADGDLLEIGHSLFCFRRVSDAALAALEQPADLLRIGSSRTSSPEMALLLGDLRRIAGSSDPVLILAETGAGKESLAEELHRASGRRGELCAVDCGAVPESLFESTFFGHRRGAFTGAVESRVGEIARADGGTLFLDEVGNLQPASQAKLLRVLEHGEVTALGAAEPKRVDVRWIAATNRELFTAGTGFRDYFLRRLAGYVARIPPLRRRREDLGALSAALLREAGVARASITVAAARALFLGELPGNIRQLRAALRSAALLAGDQPIDLEHLPAEEPADEDAKTATRQAPAAAELEAALTATGGNVVRAAERLGAHPRQLYRWLERFAIPLDRFRR